MYGLATMLDYGLAGAVTCRGFLGIVIALCPTNPEQWVLIGTDALTD